jgi:hypothetical protein
MRVNILSGNHDKEIPAWKHDLIISRDKLFDDYLLTLDIYLKWMNNEVTLKSRDLDDNDYNYSYRGIVTLIKNRLDEISLDLITLDEKLSELKHLNVHEQLTEIY